MCSSALQVASTVATVTSSVKHAGGVGPGAAALKFRVAGLHGMSSKVPTQSDDSDNLNFTLFDFQS